MSSYLFTNRKGVAPSTRPGCEKIKTSFKKRGTWFEKKRERLVPTMKFFMNRQEKFWKWFLEHENELADFEIAQERIFDELATELNRVDRDLCFEFGPKAARREFVISAGGIKRAFSAVSSLVATAPKFERWNVIGFRPRRVFSGSFQFGDKKINTEDVQFSLYDAGKVAGILVFIPGHTEGDMALTQIAYLLLDHALGEYDVETKIGPIEVLAPEMKTEVERFPFIELSKRFDDLNTMFGKSPMVT